MNNPCFKLILIDDDPIFRLGFCTALESFPDLKVVAQADSGAAALEMIDSSAGTENAIDLVVLELANGCSYPPQSLLRQKQEKGLGELVGLHLCQQLKTQFPTLPVFLLFSTREPNQLAAARATGADGYCPKGTSLLKLVSAMRLVAAGQTYWPEAIAKASVFRGHKAKPLIFQATSFILAIGRSGIRQIDATLPEVTAQLQNPSLSKLDRLIVSGRRREILAARWLVNQLLPLTESSGELSVNSYLRQIPDKRQITLADAQRLSTAPLELALDKKPNFFAATLDKFQFGVQNLTGIPMEIDVLQYEKKKELLCIILRKLENVLDELHFSQVQPSHLPQKRSMILRDLWQASITDFLGKYYTLSLGNREVEVISVLLQDAENVREDILDKIAQVSDFFSHLLFKTPLLIDNNFYSFGTPEAIERGEYMLQNLLINIGNSVVQPMLNHFADVEVIKQNFYDSRLLSSREIARFRNNLSWKYRWGKYIWEPTAIFESRYSLLVLSGTGIKQISIYASRTSELEQLKGIQLAVTLILEARDAIAPRLGSAIAFLGRGVVYVLTQVIGRGIGLIGRGIIQGIGSALQDTRSGK